MITSGETFGLVNCLALITIAMCAPMGPPNNPIPAIRMKADNIIDAGVQQGKLATEALHNQIMAVNDLQSKTLGAVGSQIAEMTTTGIQQNQAMTSAVQNQLMSAFLQQQQLASASIQAQKMAADAVYKQILSSIDLQQKLMTTGTQLPQVLVSALQQPLSAIQSVTGEVKGYRFPTMVGQMSGMQGLAAQIPGMQALAAQIPGMQQQQQQSNFGMIPMISGLDKMITLPFTLFSPLLTAAANTLAAAPAITLTAG